MIRMEGKRYRPGSRKLQFNAADQHQEIRTGHLTKPNKLHFSCNVHLIKPRSEIHLHEEISQIDTTLQTAQLQRTWQSEHYEYIHPNKILVSKVLFVLCGGPKKSFLQQRRHVQNSSANESVDLNTLSIVWAKSANCYTANWHRIH